MRYLGYLCGCVLHYDTLSPLRGRKRNACKKIHGARSRYRGIPKRAYYGFKGYSEMMRGGWVGGGQGRWNNLRHYNITRDTIDDRFGWLSAKNGERETAAAARGGRRIRRRLVAEHARPSANITDGAVTRWEFDFFPAIYLLFIEKISGKGGAVVGELYTSNIEIDNNVHGRGRDTGEAVGTRRP